MLFCICSLLYLQNEAMRLLKSGKGNEAEELLRKAIEECGYSESDYYLAIILAEILIFKVCHSLLTPGGDELLNTENLKHTDTIYHSSTAQTQQQLFVGE